MNHKQTHCRRGPGGNKAFMEQQKIHRYLGTYRQLNSEEDKSVNFVFPNGQEARFVQRTDDYMIAYLSSHSGCNMACRMCHLTQTGQTDMREATVLEMISQVEIVMRYYIDKVSLREQKPVSKVHLNWMARGDALASVNLKNNWTHLAASLMNEVNLGGVQRVEFNLSSIFPKGCFEGDLGDALVNTFGKIPLFRPVFYYSLYSLDNEFRRKWLPKAMDPEEVIAGLKKWQVVTGGTIVLHWAMIKGHNDKTEQYTAIAELVKKHELYARFNLVRYNPYSDSQGEEADPNTLTENFSIIEESMTLPGSRIVPRVGRDVAASCGTFINTL